MNLNIDKKQLSRIVILLVFDIIACAVAMFLSLWVRFDFSVETALPYIKEIVPLINIAVLFQVASLSLWRLYKSVWRYAGADELFRGVCANICTTLAILACALIFKLSIPRSFYFFFWFFDCVATIGVRFSYRALRLLRIGTRRAFRQNTGIKVMIIGAGSAANMILKEIETSRYLNLVPKCVIDDNVSNKGKRLRGIPIVGTRKDIPEMVNKYAIDEIIFAIPSASPHERKAILEICRDTDAKLRALPGMFQLIRGDVSVSKLKDVDIDDLLGREPIVINNDEVFDMLKDQVVLVTGGGGSIGSELCRQVAKHNPKQLIIFDVYENNAYDIQQELRHDYPELDLHVLIGSVRNTNRVEWMMEKYHPAFVYHAAAHKHVPLMEDSPCEAIKNNVFGTYKMAQAAVKYGVKKFVLISTDKAVNPTNVMGASKRLCEMVCQSMSGKSSTIFAMVRFGNVLGSNGSVIPLFKRQIAEGGPVTVTHPDIIRFFMTIPEAVSLVLQCGAYAKGGEVFVLDMGEPVKIVDLAKNLIRLSGLREGEDIEIKFTGLRPGEKMYEELLMNEEGLESTANNRIFIGHQVDFDREAFEDKLKVLNLAAIGEAENIRELIMDMVPTYHPENN